MDTKLRCYLSDIGRRGGLKSRRVLSPQTARQMALLREARKAFSRFQASCFWSFDPNRKIGVSDIAWVADQLRKHGDRAAWETASKLCP